MACVGRKRRFIVKSNSMAVFGSFSVLFFMMIERVSHLDTRFNRF